MAAIVQALIREIFIGDGVRGVLLWGATAIWESKGSTGFQPVSQTGKMPVLLFAAPQCVGRSYTGIIAEVTLVVCSKLLEKLRQFRLKRFPS